MGGKVYDRRPLQVDRSPTKQLAVELGKFPPLDPTKMAEQVAKFLTDWLLDAFRDVTGIDLTGWTTFLDGLPGFDASKIISGLFGAWAIPGLDASKITSGQFAQDMVTDLTANLNSLFTGLGDAIVSGDWDPLIAALFGGTTVQSTIQAPAVPALDASKITTGTFAQSMVNITTIAANWVNGVLGLPQIPALPASQTTSGTFGAGLIPGLDASKITTGTFPQSMVSLTSIAAGIVNGVLTAANIPGLDAAKITTGIFGAGTIPPLDASKVATGTFADSFIPGLLSKVGIDVFAASATAGSNLVIGPDFEDTTIPRYCYHTGSVAGGGAYSTTVARSGTHSYSLTRQAGKQETFVWLLPGVKEPGPGPNDRTTGIKCQPGQKFYLETWYWSPLTNNQAAGLNVAIEVGAVDSVTGAASWITIEQHDNTAVVQGAWTKLSGYYTIPAGKDLLFPYVHSYQGAATSTNIYYFDDVIVREETAVQNVITNLWGSAGTIGATSANLVTNGSFATDVNGWILWQWGGAANGSWDGTQGHTANGSLKLPFAGGSQQSAADFIVPCVPGQSFAVSLWAKWDANGGGAYIGVYAQDATSTYMASAAESTHNLPTGASGGWVQHNFTFTAPAGCYALDLEAASQTVGAAGNLWIDDVVIQQTNVLAPAATPNNLGDIPRLINTLFQGFIGTPSTSTSLNDAITAIQRQFGQTVQNTKDIQSLQSVATAGANSGTTVSVDFSNYADGPLPSVFTVTNVGAGTSRLGVVGGQAKFRTLVNDADVAVKVRYNVAPTATDFQIIRGTMTQAPNDGGISGNPRIYVRARVNAADDTFVWARARSIGWMLWQADIGCTVAGVETVWVSNITLPWSLNMYFKAGVGVNARVYELWSGSTLVYSHTEAGTASQLGANYRYWGATAEMRKGNFNAVTSGQIGATAVSDNAPVTVQGTHAHMNRTATGVVNLTGGSVWTLLPANFFGATVRASSDLTVDLSTGKITATKAGPYTINARIRLSGSVAANVYMGIYKNGVLDQADNFQFPGDTAGESLGGHFTTYLNAGDYIQLATWSAGLTVTVLTGEATGTQTYFNMTRVGGGG